MPAEAMRRPGGQQRPGQRETQVTEWPCRMQRQLAAHVLTRGKAPGASHSGGRPAKGA